MKAIVMQPTEIDIRSVVLNLPVRYDDEDMPYDFPHRDGDVWCVEVLVDSGQILDWPDDVEHDLYMKVTDSGSYELRDAGGNGLAGIHQDYVPHGLVPGEWGDYVHLKIGGGGVITNWPEQPDVSEFFPNGEDDD